MLKIKTLLIVLLIGIVGLAGCELDSALDAQGTTGSSAVVKGNCTVGVEWNDSDDIYYWPHHEQIAYPDNNYVKKYFYYTITNTCNIPLSVDLYEYDSTVFYAYLNQSSKYVRLILKKPVIRNRWRYISIRLKDGEGNILSGTEDTLAIYIC